MGTLSVKTGIDSLKAAYRATHKPIQPKPATFNLYNAVCSKDPAIATKTVLDMICKNPVVALQTFAGGLGPQSTPPERYYALEGLGAIALNLGKCIKDESICQKASATLRKTEQNPDKDVQEHLAWIRDRMLHEYTATTYHYNRYSAEEKKQTDNYMVKLYTGHMVQGAGAYVPSTVNIFAQDKRWDFDTTAKGNDKVVHDTDLFMHYKGKRIIKSLLPIISKPRLNTLNQARSNHKYTETASDGAPLFDIRNKIIKVKLQLPDSFFSKGQSYVTGISGQIWIHSQNGARLKWSDSNWNQGKVGGFNSNYDSKTKTLTLVLDTDLKERYKEISSEDLINVRDIGVKVDSDGYRPSGDIKILSTEITDKN